MHFFHPRFSSTQALQSSLTPRSAWAKAHAVQVSLWPKTLVTISDSRTSTLDFLALQHAVEAAMGQTCSAIEWVSEGGPNQLYLVTLADGLEILARIAFPFPHRVRTGDAFAFQEAYDRTRIPSRMQSEVATIRHIHAHTQIPVARIYAYDNNLTNPVGSPYMLQEVLQGTNLSNHWKGRDKKEWHDATTKSLGKIYGTILSLKFDGYGSLKPDTSTGSMLGPLLDPIPSLHRNHTLTDTGPWPVSQPISLHLALAVRELQWLESETGRQLFNQWRDKMHPKEDCSMTLPAFLKFASALVDIIPHMYSLFPLPEVACRPALFHADFHYSNIQVSHEDPTVVTGVVDWEFASIFPLWAAYNVPPPLEDYGDEYELEPEWRAHKERLRTTFAQAVVAACPDAAIVAQAGDEQTMQSLRGLRLLVKMATSGVSLYKSFENVRAELIKLRECIRVRDGAIVENLGHLVTLFSQPC